MCLCRSAHIILTRDPIRSDSGFSNSCSRVCNSNYKPKLCQPMLTCTVRVTQSTDVDHLLRLDLAQIGQKKPLIGRPTYLPHYTKRIAPIGFFLQATCPSQCLFNPQNTEYINEICCNYCCQGWHQGVCFHFVGACICACVCQWDDSERCKRIFDDFFLVEI